MTKEEDISLFRGEQANKSTFETVTQSQTNAQVERERITKNLDAAYANASSK